MSNFCSNFCFDGKCFSEGECEDDLIVDSLICNSTSVISDQNLCCGDNLMICESNQLKTNEKCEFGCKFDERRCYDQYEVGAFCEKDFCYNDFDCERTGIYECSSNKVTMQIQDCCQSSGKQCNNDLKCINYNDFGALCEDNEKWYCSGDGLRYYCNENHVSNFDRCDMKCDNGECVRIDFQLIGLIPYFCVFGLSTLIFCSFFILFCACTFYYCGKKDFSSKNTCPKTENNI